MDSVRRYGWLGGRRGDELRVSLIGAGDDASPRFFYIGTWLKSFHNFLRPLTAPGDPPYVACMSRRSSLTSPTSPASRSAHTPPTLAEQARATLATVQYATGIRVGGIELSPRMTREERRALASWVRRLPEGFTNRLPRLKLAVADELGLVRSSVFVNGIPSGIPGQAARENDRRPQNRLHAASFIPQRYVVFHRDLFRRRVELGRILYHELCHFLWPRLGNRLRQGYEAMLQAEFDAGTRGELGYSAEWRKEKLRAEGGAVRKKTRLWREYVCESFCDTASYVLLGSERRGKHSEYTLSRAARERRRRWMGNWGVGE